MPTHELDRFLATWEFETLATQRLLEALPGEQYDLRPDAGGRSLGELAWHLAEVEVFVTHGIAENKFSHGMKLPIQTRPREVRLLAPGYNEVHKESVARVRALRAEDLDRTPDFMGRPMKVRDLLWAVLLHHQIHHRGQLALMCRIAGGTCPAIYGPNREDSAALRAKAAATA
jgi:uncharacterized damage-inducible protein DinB